MRTRFALSALLVVAACGPELPISHAPSTRASAEAPPREAIESEATLPTVAALLSGHGACAIRGRRLGCSEPWVEIDEPLAGVAVSVVFPYACAVGVEGTVRCWGQNRDGQLGLGRRSESEPPTRVALPGPVVDLAASVEGTCVIVAGGALSCWGSGLDAPTPVELDGPAAQVVAADEHIVVTLKDGRIFHIEPPAHEHPARFAARWIPGTADFQSGAFVWHLEKEAFVACGLKAGRVSCTGEDRDKPYGFHYAEGLGEALMLAMDRRSACAITPARRVRCALMGSAPAEIAGLEDVSEIVLNGVGLACARSGERIRCFKPEDAPLRLVDPFAEPTAAPP